MTVVNSNKFIFCEGKSTSLDYRLITRILKDIPSETITIIPSGGKFSFSSFINGYFSSTTTNNRKYLIFRDRDFDLKPTKDTRLIKGDQPKTWLSYRACIENYFLDAELINNYWQYYYQKKQELPNLKWGHGNSPGITTIAEWIRLAAQNLTDYQAIRWSLADLLNSSVAKKQLKTTWTGSSGKLPPSLSLSELKTKAIELISDFRATVDLVTIERFEENFRNYQQQFNQESFWQQKQYLIWFHGKDIQKQMQKQESRYIAFNSTFNDWAIDNLEITKHQDLLELQSNISQL